MDQNESLNFSELTAEIVAAYVSNNNVRPEELASLIGDVHAALKRTPNGQAQAAPEPQEPAVPVRSSIRPDFIVCLEDGKKFKSLKRHLQGEHGMTPAEYRAKWGLKSDYPMVAPNYSEARSTLARSMGLGRKPQSESPGDNSESDAAQDTSAASQRGRRARARA